jgi:4-hydroxybenzoate polyprenyltransferase
VKLGPALRLLRPRQWTKNLLVFAALIFAHQFDQPLKVELAIWAFVALCLFSSAVYGVNDVLDAERDRAHPTKRTRPVASGEVTPLAALVVSGLCLAAGTVIGAYVGPDFLVGSYVYVFLQALYNLWLKSVPVVDVMVVSTGFVLRAALGAVAIMASISGWLLFCTGMLALVLASAKRRHEFHLQGDGRGESRTALLGYTAQSLDAMVVFSAAVAAISYGIYAIESETARQYPALVLTVPFVLFGVLRYLYIAFAQQQGGEPENVLLTDWQVLTAVVLFIAAAFFALSGGEVPYVDLG